MNHGSLFSGGGGFDLAAEKIGWNNIFHCEKDSFCRTILNHYWPKSKTYEDIREFKGAPYHGHIDIITGGFPCQPFSAAGKRQGTNDDRYLWPEMLRVIREIKPRWVVGENVHGLVTWNTGLVFDQVHIDLEAEGYEVRAFILPAAGVNAPHRRDRVWFIAHSPNQNGSWQNNTLNIKREQKNDKAWSNLQPELSGTCNLTKITSTDESNFWADWPSESPLCSPDDGVSFGLDNITFSKWRKESIKVFGNAIVNQVAYEIFKAIDTIERM